MLISHPNLAGKNFFILIRMVDSWAVARAYDAEGNITDRVINELNVSND